MLVEFFYFLTLRWRKLYLGTGSSLFLSVPKPGLRPMLRRLVGTGPFYTTLGGNIVAHFETRVIDFLVMMKPHPVCLYN